jgi:hypothetical protein
VADSRLRSSRASSLGESFRERERIVHLLM